MTPSPFVNERLLEAARDERALFVFCHAQRTGGAAFRRAYLAKVLGKDRVYAKQTVAGFRRWEKLTEADLEGFRAFAGHSNFKDLGLRRPTVFLGLARHPLFRAASLYFYCREKADHPLHALANATGPEAFHRRASEEMPAYFRDTQCLRLCGHADADLALETVERHFLAVGFTADLGGFTTALSDALGWPRIDLGTRADEEERYRDVLTDGFREAVLAGNTQDLRLFEALSARTAGALR